MYVHRSARSRGWHRLDGMNDNHPVRGMRNPTLARSVGGMNTSLRTETAAHEAAAVLPSWRDGSAKRAILKFVAETCGRDGCAPVPVEERVAVFDNDGTLWCEKPMPI